MQSASAFVMRDLDPRSSQRRSVFERAWGDDKITAAYVIALEGANGYKRRAHKEHDEIRPRERHV